MASVLEGQDSPTLSIALRYAAAGFKVMPLHSMQERKCTCGNPACGSPGKHPLEFHGSHDASADEKVIRRWLRKWPNCNIGITLGGHVVVDVDPRHRGHLSLENLLRQYGEFPDTAVQATGGGGHHYLFKAAPGVKYAGALPGGGIDLKHGAGAYIVVEPSNHESGGSYVWQDESGPHEQGIIAEAPKWLSEIRAKSNVVAGPGSGKIATGGRNSFLYERGRRMRDDHFPQSAIYAALLVLNSEVCVTPLETDEVFTIAKSAAQNEPPPLEANPDDPDKPFWRYPGVWLDDTTANLNSEYLIKGVINYGDYAVVYGPSGDGKTFFTIDLALHIAAGLPWRGKRVHQYMVVYVAAEAGHSIERRFAAARDSKLSQATTNTPLIYLPRGPNLMDAVESVELLADLGMLAELALQRGSKLGLVVFDTVARSMAGGDENSAQDMGKVVEMGNKIRAGTGAATLVVHHTGKDPNKGMRGSSAIFAASDSVISVIQKVATVEKSKDGSSGNSFPFHLKVVELGEDSDGEVITTCVVESSNEPMIGKARQPAGRNQKVVWDVLREMLVVDGVRMPGTSTIPANVEAVSVTKLISHCFPKFPGMLEWRARDRVSQALVGMQASNLIGIEGDWVWLY